MKGRLDVLDIVRFFAAFFVVYYHYLYRGWKVDSLSDVTFNDYDGFFKYGYLGVQLFFLISGFVISLSIKNKTPNQFFISRAVRLFPAFWVSAILTYFFIIIFDDGRFYIAFVDFLLNLTMISKLFGIPFLDGAYWTLIYELVFYFWCFISLKYKFIKIDVLLIVGLILSILSMLFEVKSAYTILWCGNFMPYFAAGYYFFRVYTGKSSTLDIILIFICFFGSLLQAYLQLTQKNSNLGIDLNTLTVMVLIFFIYVFFTTLAIGKFSRLSIPKAAFLGSLTYPSYLLHQNIGYITFNYIGNSINAWITLSIVSAFLFYISWLIASKAEPYIGLKLKELLKSKMLLGKEN